MNAFVACITFLLETVVGAGAQVLLTKSAQAPAGGLDLGDIVAGPNFTVGYYILTIQNFGGLTPENDFVGYWQVTAP